MTESVLTTSWVVSESLRAGDIITVDCRLTKWQRFLIWVARPWQWPPKYAVRRFEVVGVTSDTLFEIEHRDTVLPQ